MGRGHFAEEQNAEMKKKGNATACEHTCKGSTDKMRGEGLVRHLDITVKKTMRTISKKRKEVIRAEVSASTTATLGDVDVACD